MVIINPARVLPLFFFLVANGRSSAFQLRRNVCFRYELLCTVKSTNHITTRRDSHERPQLKLLFLAYINVNKQTDKVIIN